MGKSVFGSPACGDNPSRFVQEFAERTEVAFRGRANRRRAFSQRGSDGVALVHQTIDQRVGLTWARRRGTTEKQRF